MVTNRDPEPSSTTPASLAALVLSLRERALLTQEELARRSGLSVGTIRRLESGRISRPRTGSLRLLADALALTEQDRAALVQAVQGTPPAVGVDPPTAPDTTSPRALDATSTPTADATSIPTADATSIPTADAALTATTGVVPTGVADSAPTAVPDSGSTGGIGAGVLPAQLPTAVAGFVGRAEALKWLDEMFRLTTASSSATVVSMIVGTAGVGKTSLAVHWAHQVRDRFPDGQLYVDLRGFDPARPPAAPTEVLQGFFDALQVPPRRIPDTLDAQTGLFRSLLADRRMLLLLDNARDADQVRPLLPGSPGSLVLVTSRNQLAGLVVAEGAALLPLDLLSTPEARDLLARRLGEERLATDPKAVADLVEHCARLPLALAIVAARAALYPEFPLAGIADQLAEAREGCRPADHGEQGTDLWSVFSWSYRTLDPVAARLFRLLGLHPGPETDGYAAAALAGTDLRVTRRALDQLVRTHLVQLKTPGRYGMHDLMRAYARDLATAEDPASTAGPEDAPETALGRLFDHYLSGAAAAMDRLHPAEADDRPRVPPPATPLPRLPDPDSARRWLDSERANLVVVAGHTAEHGWPNHAVRLSGTLHRYLDGGHYADAVSIHDHARRAAHRIGDQGGEARALLGLAAATGQLGRYPSAAEFLDRALTLARQAGDQPGEARILGGLGLIQQRLGRYRSAEEHYLRALAIYRRVGGRSGEARMLVNLGSVELRMQRYDLAADHFGQALARYRQDGNRIGEANVLNNLGEVAMWSGRYDLATEQLEQALVRYRQLGNPRGEASALDNLGSTLIRMGRPGQAAEHLGRALAIFREIGDRDGEAWVRNGLGEAAQVAGRPAEAVAQHIAALAVTTETGAREQQARAHAGLGRAHQDLGDLDRARAHYADALDRYAEIGSPRADDVRERLAGLPESGAR